ncbi:cell division protein FtsL [Pseudomarimonas salicorniae]|uniref:Cell division protein FtsL n=1 Tax=Pseudomarimonas salicorniae TaxID=2933270 RepID=A0ABT0GHF3_9GAMM|nr:cell division protein FtsL [Lysobacter sp. CAU 1642]MCK7593965.1 cell division protein FtsL [Lysobacter sp. CAU 1642]
MRFSTFFCLALLIAVVISALAVVHGRHQHRQLFVELSELEKQRDELNIEFGRLQLEQATWADPNRIEQIARGPLGMKYPEATDLRVVTP